MDPLEMIRDDSREYRNKNKNNLTHYCEVRSEIAASKLYSEDSKEREEFKKYYSSVLEEDIKDRI